MQGIIFFVTTSELSLYCLESCVYTVMSINSVFVSFESHEFIFVPINKILYCSRYETSGSSVWRTLACPALSRNARPTTRPTTPTSTPAVRRFTARGRRRQPPAAACTAAPPRPSLASMTREQLEAARAGEYVRRRAGSTQPARVKMAVAGSTQRVARQRSSRLPRISSQTPTFW